MLPESLEERSACNGRDYSDGGRGAQWGYNPGVLPWRKAGRAGRSGGHEENVSTEEAGSQQETWVSCPDALSIWKGNHRPPAEKGSDEVSSIGVGAPKGARPGRLRKPVEFQRVFREGRQRSGPNLVVHALRQDGGSLTRVGLSVPRSVGGAVAMNRVRRRLRELLRSEASRLTPGFACIVVARPGAGGASWGELGAELFESMRRLGVVDSWWERAR